MNSVSAFRRGSQRRRRRGAARLGLVMVALSLAVASCGGPASPARGPSPAAGSAAVNSLRIKSCTVDGISARCGTLIVPENRLTGKGRTIPVRFVVIPAFGPDRAPDPVVYFAGGPGRSAVADIPSELPNLLSLNEHRDLVFIEQRGTGRSSPLTCPAFPGPGAGASTAMLRARVTSCLAHLRGDLRFYTTAMYADDVSQVLNDLHYGKVNVMGISYGTAVEQVFQLRHPGQVRTMTMQSGSPLSVQVIERAPGNAQRALDYVFARCASQPDCHRAFPHLAADWASLWASLGRSPWVLPAAQSPTKTTQRITQDDFANALYEAMYGFDEDLIPASVHALATAGNKAAAILAVIRAGQAAGGASSGGANLMMPYTITCAEPWASDRPAALSGQRGSFAYHMFLVNAQWWQAVCPLIPKSAAAVGDLRLRASHVPVLAFNGGGDPIEQPWNWAGAQKFWPDSRHITLPGQGHNVDSASWQICAGPLTSKFISRASVAHLNTGCLAYIAPPFRLALR